MHTTLSHTSPLVNFENSLAFAQKLDQADSLKHFRDKFYIPKRNGEEIIYLCGNSLGLQPKNARLYIEEEMQKWQDLAVDGHFHTKNRWFDYHKLLKPTTAKLVGAKEDEVVCMNNLTTNLHLMLTSFYQPTAKKHKILMEGGAFPSDQYAIETQVKLHGFNPNDTIVEIFPREGEFTLQNEDILAKINELRDELALILMGGVNYYTGQVFDMQSITKAGHQVGASVGFDLAHAVGNIPLDLHNWQVDFAVWCTYKYLNSSPGGIAGTYVHEKHHKANLPRLGGWWGQNEKERFLMQKGFKPTENADGWQLANAPILLMAAHRASLEIFEEAGIDKLREKSLKLTKFLENILQEVVPAIKVITPKDEKARGCQLSLLIEKNGKDLFDKLHQAGIVGDWREPQVIRLTPIPLYNTFEEIYRVGKVLASIFNK